MEKNNELIEDLIVTSKEALKILGITKARLSQLVKKKKITPIKKGVFLIEDVLKRRSEQERLRLLYYHPKKASNIIEEEKEEM